MNKVLKLIIVFTLLFISITLLSFSYYVYQLSPTSKNEAKIKIEIPKGSTGSSVAAILKENDLIKDVTIFKLYLKFHKVNDINYGTYELNKAMGVKQIVDIISKGNTANADISILFKEGLNIRGIAKVIALNTNNTEEDVFNLLKDEEYINTIISDYWFIDESIKNEKIYYPLEGYLAPNTYRFVNKDVTVKEIFKKMLDQMDTVLTPFKDKMNGFTVHEFLTLASVVQSEGVNGKDWSKIASVFYNRLDNNDRLGSCVTACYATKTEPCLSDKVNTKYNSPYNTYLISMAGKLPVGPVSNPGEGAIAATANPADTDYYFFLSDKNRNLYFSKTSNEHLAKKAELQASGEWLTD